MRISPFHVIFAIAVIVLIAFLVFRKSGPGTQLIRASDLEFQPGPIRHARLPEPLVARIRNFEPVFAEVYSRTHQEWLDGFQRDINPESEVAVWEAMAVAYQNFTRERALSLEAKSEAFGLLLVRSAADEQQTLSDAKLKYLTRADAEKLLRLYSAPPKPIAVERKP